MGEKKGGKKLDSRRKEAKSGQLCSQEKNKGQGDGADGFVS
jgi:hypothetical protein